MQRAAVLYLKEWLSHKNRKPLVLRGARQVGKTHAIRQLAQLTDHRLIEINFEKQIQLQSLFEDNDPKKIILNIEAHYGIEVDVNNTILFLDEIQAAPQLLAKLRWFAEDLPALAVISAGSLLDFVLDDHQFSMPVGRITYLHMTPLSYEEFLKMNNHKLYDFLQQFQLGDVIPAVIHQQLKNFFTEYLIVGGMPAAVFSWIEKKSLSDVHRIHLDLLSSYRDDFAKYAGRVSIDRLEDVMMAVPRMLGQKFVYSRVNKAVKSEALKQALNLLNKARVCQKINACHANGIPLLSELNEKIFKVIFLDVGLVSSQLGLRLNQVHQIEEIDLINDGAIAEQVVGQLLQTIEPLYVDPLLCYWVREQKSSNAELDYLIQHDTHIVPVEVKSGSTGSLKSLHVLMYEKKLATAVRINSELPSLVKVAIEIHQQQKVNYDLLSVPFYLLGQIHRLLEKTMCL